MERSFFCHEQVYQMHASYDALVMVKVAHDAGADVMNNPIEFFCYEWGGQTSVFFECLRRIFGEYQSDWEQNEYLEEEVHLNIPLPQLRDFHALLSEEESARSIKKFNQLLNHSCDHFEMEMKGSVIGHSLRVTLTNMYGVQSSFLKRIVAIKNEVLAVIRERRERIINNFRNIVLLKSVWDKLEEPLIASLSDSTNDVFANVMTSLKSNLSEEEIRSLCFEDMLEQIQESCYQGENKIMEKDEAA
ncbi:hypothetical protein QYF50_07105 [Paenibacillus vini]|uniref:hypothetical protein n=1 Tax=Paenibacillus vini TaxID=1476024 RepID=UPI0025B63DD0|nr:hypothetical protein [Paenibacillus vini]MDN4067660.1 hypothetical protein [Paenibacillus vini]